MREGRLGGSATSVSSWGSTSTSAAHSGREVSVRGWLTTCGPPNALTDTSTTCGHTRCWKRFGSPTTGSRVSMSGRGAWLGCRARRCRWPDSGLRTAAARRTCTSLKSVFLCSSEPPAKHSRFCLSQNSFSRIIRPRRYLWKSKRSGKREMSGFCWSMTTRTSLS